MEAGESEIVSARKRTESCGAGSDSDVSDGWNFVEHVDTNQHDIPSSDGESVEVIEPDNDLTEQVEEQVDEAQEAEDDETQLIPQSAAEVVPVVEVNEVALNQPNNVPRPEEMFDTSFCWFLFFSVSAVLLSNVVFMAAESSFDWNVDLNILENTPSFLRDLPVTPKLPSQERIVRTNSGIDKEGTCVSQLVDGVQQLARDCQDKLENSNPKVQTNAQQKNIPMKIDITNIRKHFQRLGDTSDSINVQNIFARTLLILDALQIGLNDLEEVVTDNSDLKNTLKLQKEQLHEVLREIEYGVSRAMDKIASNVLFRVQKLESSFEKEWCELEKSGHKEELKGLFFECPELDERSFKSDYKPSDKFRDARKYEDKSKNRHSSKDDYKYEVDKDSTGKYYSKSEGKGFESDEFVKKLKNGNPLYKKGEGTNFNEKSKKERFRDDYLNKDRKTQYLKNSEEVPRKPEQIKFQEQNSEILDANIGDQTKSSSNNGKVLHDGLKYTEETEVKGKEQIYSKFETEAEFSNRNPHIPESGEYDSNLFKNKESIILDSGRIKSFDTTDSHHFKKHENRKNRYEQTREKKDDYKKSHYEDKSNLEKIGKYLKESCKKIGEKAKNLVEYETLHKKIEDIAKIPIGVFNNMFQKYCTGSEKKYRQNNFNQENLKGEFRKKSYEKRELPTDRNPYIIEDPNSYRGNDFEFDFVETTSKQEGKFRHPGRDKIIEPTNKNRQWTFSYDEPLTDNKTNHNGYWFLKAGESRSRTRWRHHRSDWLFDRASYRRHGSHYFSTFPEKRSNWFFRRAYAREQCQQNPSGEWCNYPQDDKVTLSSSKFR